MTTLAFGRYPSPIERVESLGLWVKRDDLVSDLYGGNKVRKLERLLFDARARGKSRLSTIGAAGSHQVVATSLYGRREGFSVEAVLVPQPANEHARRNLRIALANGLEPIIASSWAVAPALALARAGRDTYFIPLGGSDAVGSLGFVDAAKELAEQVGAGLMPEPDVIVVAMGSGGTAAGLAVGLEAARLRTRVVGVAISHPASMLSVMARHVAKKTAELAGLSRRESVMAVRRMDFDKRWIGRGYAVPTSEGEDAIALAAAAGISLDATYTAKAFACALAYVRESPGRTVLFWNTLSSAPLDASALPELPANAASLFR